MLGLWFDQLDRPDHVEHRICYAMKASLVKDHESEKKKVQLSNQFYWRDHEEPDEKTDLDDLDLRQQGDLVLDFSHAEDSSMGDV